MVLLLNYRRIVNITKKSNGNLRVIDKEAGKSCNTLENPISWPSTANASPLVLSNRIQTATGTSGQTMLSIPNFGTFTVSNCNDDSGSALFSFTNTGTHTLDFGIGNGLNGTNPNPTLAPGATFDLSDGQYSTGNNTVVLGYGTGANSKIATVQLYSQNDAGVSAQTGCRFDVIATVK